MFGHSFSFWGPQPPPPFPPVISCSTGRSVGDALVQWIEAMSSVERTLLGMGIGVALLLLFLVPALVIRGGRY